MELKDKIKKDIEYLKNNNFEISYSEKDRVLVIEKESMFIHGLKNMLMIGIENDTESFNIYQKDFIESYSFIEEEEDIFGIDCFGRWVKIDLEDELDINKLPHKKNKIRTKIGFLISMHINNNFEYLEKQERLKNLVLSI